MQHLILLHGALGASSQFDALAEKLRNQFQVHTFNFSGHGGRPFSDAGFSVPAFSAEILDYLDRHDIQQAAVFGYSMGGYVALYLAARHPGRFSRIMTLATKLHWDETTAAKETGMLDPLKIEQKIPAFARSLEERHAPNDWKAVLQHTAGLMRELGAGHGLTDADYPVIDIPVLLLLGDRDKMVSVEETLDVYRKLPQAGWGILPFTGHPLEQVAGEELDFRIRRFLGAAQN